MTLPSVDLITNKYLYGFDDTPENLIDEKFIRPSGADDKVDIDVNEYMTEGPGRFALGSEFVLIQYFFNMDFHLDPGVYFKEDLAQRYSLSYYGLIQKQTEIADGKADRPPRFIARKPAWRLNVLRSCLNDRRYRMEGKNYD